MPSVHEQEDFPLSPHDSVTETVWREWISTFYTAVAECNTCIRDGFEAGIHTPDFERPSVTTTGLSDNFLTDQLYDELIGGLFQQISLRLDGRQTRTTVPEWLSTEPTVIRDSGWEPTFLLSVNHEGDGLRTVIESTRVTVLADDDTTLTFTVVDKTRELEEILALDDSMRTVALTGVEDGAPVLRIRYEQTEWETESSTVSVRTLLWVQEQSRTQTDEQCVLTLFRAVEGESGLRSLYQVIAGHKPGMALFGVKPDWAAICAEQLPLLGVQFVYADETGNAFVVEGGRDVTPYVKLATESNTEQHRQRGELLGYPDAAVDNFCKTDVFKDVPSPNELVYDLLCAGRLTQNEVQWYRLAEYRAPSTSEGIKEAIQYGKEVERVIAEMDERFGVDYGERALRKETGPDTLDFQRDIEWLYSNAGYTS